MKEPTEDGGGPAGVVEGCDGSNKGAKGFLILVFDSGVEGSGGLEENGTSKAGIVSDLCRLAYFDH